MAWIDYILLGVSLVLIILVLLQQSSDDIRSAFSGDSNELFKNRKSQGLEKGLKITTLIFTIIFVGLAVGSRFVTPA